MEINKIYCMDALDLCNSLEPQSVNLILADLPYGTTACSWDEVIPFAPMWAAFKRIIKPRGAIVLTASQPFTSRLVHSNIKMFRYEWIWRKPQGTGYLNANIQPMKNHESALVFSISSHNYYPQMRSGKPFRATRGAAGGFVRDKTVGGYVTVNQGERYPLSVLYFDSETGLHPTQKPVPLFEYLIRTYTKPGELVLDPVVGSGTTAIAARNLQRNFICGDSSKEFVEIAIQRLAEPYTPPMILDEPAEVKPETHQISFEDML